MAYRQIVYRSFASATTTEADVYDILRKSQSSNSQAKISGILLFKDGVFWQFLEGPPKAVDALFARLSGDPRHHDVYVLADCVGERLLMPTWAMAYSSSSPSLNVSDTFVLDYRQALSICESLPEHIGSYFFQHSK